MAHPLEGRTLDGAYKLLYPLGAGAMGAVFRAQDEDGFDIAVKVVHDQTAEALSAQQRFFREVKSLNKLRHPNIVALLDFGRDEALNVSYIVMELADGDDLTRLVRMGRAEPNLALLVARHVADGLALAHDLGVVHRDLKPGNVILCPNADGTVVAKVLDFGLAMLTDAETSLTKTGTAPGTVNYMSPEQLKGERADARTDIYGLGVVLYELLSGRACFTGANQTEIALSVLQGPPPPHLSAIVPDVPRPLGDLVAWMLQRDRDARPASADEVIVRAAKIDLELDLPPVRVSHRGPSRKPRADWALKPAR